MTLNIEQALKEGFSRTITRNGLLLVVAVGAFGAVNMLAYNSFMAGLLPEAFEQEMGFIGPTLPISSSVAGVILLVAYLASFTITAVALRTFVTDETQTIPREYVTRNLGWFLLNYLVGFVVFLFAVWIGFILLVVPGIFLMVSLYFWIVFVAVEDENFIGAFRSSWALTKGNRWPLLGLGLIMVVAGMVLFSIPFGISAVLSAWAALVGLVVVSGVFGIFSWATTARVYVQLNGEDPADDPAIVA